MANRIKICRDCEGMLPAGDYCYDDDDNSITELIEAMLKDN